MMSIIFFATQLVLTWTATADPSVKGYYVHVGTASGVYTEKVDVGKVTTANYNASQNGNVYFAVSAYNDFVESPKSTEAIANLTPLAAPTNVRVAKP